MLFQVPIGNVSGAARLQSVGHLQDDVTSALAPVENAGSVFETAIRSGQFSGLAVAQIEGADGFDGVGDFLPVGSDVLDRSTADASGNAAETLHAGAVAGDGVGYEGVPFLARADFVMYDSIFFAILHSLDGNLEDQARPPGVGNYQVAASTEHEERQIFRPGER